MEELRRIKIKEKRSDLEQKVMDMTGDAKPPLEYKGYFHKWLSDGEAIIELENGGEVRKFSLDEYHIWFVRPDLPPIN